MKIPLSQTQSSITLGELIKMVKLSSVHLVHDEVDIELATIEDLSDSMFTEEGRAAWRDVLNAKVNEIFNGYYGVQIECSDVDHERLTEFSYALAGYGPASEYNTWFINSEDEGPNMSM